VRRRIIDLGPEGGPEGGGDGVVVGAGSPERNADVRRSYTEILRRVLVEGKNDAHKTHGLIGLMSLLAPLARADTSALKLPKRGCHFRKSCPEVGRCAVAGVVKESAP